MFDGVLVENERCGIDVVVLPPHFLNIFMKAELG